MMSMRDTFHWMVIVMRIHEAMICPWLRSGFGGNYIGVYGLIAFPVMLFIAGNMRDVIMWRYAWLTMLVMVVRRVGVLIRWHRGNSEHSGWHGYPTVARLLGFGRFSMKAEPILCAAIGWLVYPFSEALGKLYLGGAFSLAYLEAIRVVMRLNREQARRDAGLEMEDQIG